MTATTATPATTAARTHYGTPATLEHERAAIRNRHYNHRNNTHKANR